MRAGLRPQASGLGKACFIAAMSLVLGCVDDLGSPTEIESNRVLAAVAEVNGMPGVAWPAPGEEIAVRIVVVDERAPRAIGYRLIACAESEPRTGASECVGEPFAEAVRDAPSVDDPVIAFVAPALETLEPMGRVLVRGVVCVESAAADTARCADPEAFASRLRYSVQVVAPGAPRNHNPSLDALEIDGAPWPETPLPDPGVPCDATDMPTVRAGSDPVPISFGAAPGSLEPRETAGDEPATETLQISHHATAAELDQAFSFITEPEGRGEVRFTPPEPDDVPEAGEIVRMWLVALDQRGGTGVTERSLCLVR